MSEPRDGVAKRFLASGEPAGPAAILRAQWHLGHALPEQYRRFLRTRNGGRVEPNALRTHQNVVGITTFLGVGCADPDDDLVSVYREFRPRVPAGLVPIAHAAGGNLLCVSVRAQDRGAVFFWDHELEASDGEPPTERSVALVAASVTDLLAALVPASSIELPEVIVLHAWIDPDFRAALDEDG